MSCGDYGCDDGCCGNAQCLPSAKRPDHAALPLEGAFHRAIKPLLPKRDQGRVMGAYREVHGVTVFDEDAERQQFEDRAFEHYLRKRDARAAAGSQVAFDTPDRPSTREEMFGRHPSGDYIVLAYQAAWSGWKMARGV